MKALNGPSDKNVGRQDKTERENHRLDPAYGIHNGGLISEFGLMMLLGYMLLVLILKVSTTYIIVAAWVNVNTGGVLIILNAGTGCLLKLFKIISQRL